MTITFLFTDGMADPAGDTLWSRKGIHALCTATLREGAKDGRVAEAGPELGIHKGTWSRLSLELCQERAKIANQLFDESSAGVPHKI
jgi:hypothetical protein